MPVGQNIHYHSGASNYWDPKYLKGAVNSWFGEITLTNAELIKKFAGYVFI